MSHPWQICRVVLLLPLAAPYALAQETAKPPGPSASEDQPTREQTIYIPYAKLRQIFEKEGRGVFVPYEEFQRLWKAAQNAAKKIEEYKPPIGDLIAEIESEATVRRDVMTVTAKLQIEVLTAGWHGVPLRLKDSAIRSAKIVDKPARLLYSPDSGYRVLLEKKGKEPEKIELVLEYSKAFTKQPGTNRIEFDAPQAPVNRWQIRIPEPGVKVNVQPDISATDGDEKELKPDQSVAGAKQETLVQAIVGAAQTVRIEWTAKAEGAAGLAALVTVQARQEVTIDEGVVHTRTNLAYDIQRADVTQLVVEVPADHNVVNVFDPNVQKWEKNAEGSIQKLTITLFQPTRGTQNVMIELEKFAGDKEMPQEMTHAEIRVPVVRAVQAGTPESMGIVGRQQGVVVVSLGTALRGEATSRTGLLQIDAAELPAPLAKQQWAFAFRYAALPFDLLLSVDKLLPQVEVEELVETYVEPTQITVDLLAILNVQRAGIFQIELEVPEAYDIRSVQGAAAAGVSAVTVDSYHFEDVEYTPNPAQPEVKAKRRTKLVVNLARRALGKVGLRLEMIKRQEDANLLAPTGTISVIRVPLPRVQPASVARTSGRILVYSPESLRLSPKEAKGLRPISLGEAMQQISSTREGRFPQLRELTAYAYTQETTSLTVEGQRRKPYIETRELLAAHIESGVVRYEAMLLFDIKYSSVNTLRIDVPKDIADKVRNLTPALRDERIEPQPADLANDYVAWQLVGERELLGSVAAKFTWEEKSGELKVGQASDIKLPQIKAVGVDRFWGQIVASKAETIEIGVKDEPQGLHPIDPQRDLMAGADVPNAARAFEFHEDWSLNLQATRYQLEEVKRTSIDRAFVRMVVTRGGKVAVQALYRLRSARQRVPLKIPDVDPQNPAGALDSQPLRINNQSAPLEHDGTQFFIPLIGHSADGPVLVELRYTVPGNSSSLQLPEFQDDPAVQQVYLAVWLPEERKLLGVGGPWTNENVESIPSLPAADAPDDASLLSQLRQGIANCESAGDGFPVDGRRYLFSALQPDADRAGALRLIAAHRNAVNAALFLIVAIVGLALTPRPIGTRLWWLAGLVVAIVLVAVFAPTLAGALLAPPLYLAIGLVLLAWIARCLAWFMPEFVAWQSSRFRSAAAATAVAAAASTAAAPPVDATPPPSPPPAGQEGGPSHG